MGQLPDSVKVLNGSAAVGTRDGARVLRARETGRNFNWTVLEFRLNETLPENFTIEFDLHAPLSTSYPLEIRAGLPGDPLAYLGASARENRVVANCGAVRTGIYGSLTTTLTQKQDRFDTTAVRRCRVAVAGQRVEVSFHEVALAQDNVDFKRSRSIVMVVPARAGEEAHIGPLTVSGSPSVATGLATDPPNPSTGAAEQGGSGTSEPAPVSEATPVPEVTTAPEPTSLPAAPTPATHRAGHVTGGGWITLPDNVRANFGFVVRSTGGAKPEGNFQLNWRAPGGGGSSAFRSRAFTAFTPGSTTIFSGTGTLNGQPGYTFTVTAVEGSPHRMRIEITPAAGDISDTGSRPVEGGNITVHRQ
ncbi:MAG TPA: post-COAP-1 domain-containing protein [Gemmatimonadaceae bacterium]|nr:post-COAP-1 domain-containing protein [Gemmatimonadaceae bacterium]